MISGRISLDQNKPILDSDITSSAVYLLGYKGATSKLFNGTSMQDVQFTPAPTNNVGPSIGFANDNGTIWRPGAIHDIYEFLLNGVSVLGSIAWVSGAPAVADAMYLGLRVNSAAMTVQTTNGPVAVPQYGGLYRGTIQFDVPGSGQIFSSAFAANSSGNAGTSMRQICGTSTGGSQIQVTFNSCTSGPFQVTHASVGVQSSAYNTNATPVELKFSGSSGFTIPANGAPLTSDVLNFPTNAGDVIVVITDVATDAMPRNGSGQSWNQFNNQTWNVAAPTGTWNSFSYNYCVSSVTIPQQSTPSITVTASHGLNRKWPIWNYFNRSPIRMLAGDNNNTAYSVNMGAPYQPTNPNPALIRPIGGNSGNSLTVLVGRKEEQAEITLDFIRRLYWSDSGTQAELMTGIGWGTTASLAVDGGTLGVNNWEFLGPGTNLAVVQGIMVPARYVSQKFQGSVVVTAMENANGDAQAFAAHGSLLLAARYRG